MTPDRWRHLGVRLNTWIPIEEYLELYEAAKDADESITRYIRKACAARYEADHPDRLPWGVRFRDEGPRLRIRKLRTRR